MPEDRVGVLQKYDVFWMSGPKNLKKMLDTVHKILTFKKKNVYIIIIMVLYIYQEAPGL